MQVLHVNRIFRFICLLALTACFCILQTPSQFLQISPAQASDATQLVRQGIEHYRNDEYDNAISDWEKALLKYPEDESSPQRALILENLARAHHQLGQPTQALTRWQEATDIYTDLQNWNKVASTLTEQAQAYGRIGQPFQSIGLLCGDAEQLSIIIGDETSSDDLKLQDICLPESAISIVERADNSEIGIKLAARGSLGEAFRSIQSYDAAISVLQKTLLLDKQSHNPLIQARLQNSLGNTLREKAEFNYQQAATSLRSASGDEDDFHEKAEMARNEALDHLKISRDIANEAKYTALAIKAGVGLMAVESHIEGNQAAVDALRKEAVTLLEDLPSNQERAYLALQLTKQKLPLADSDGIARTDYTYESSRKRCKDIYQDSSVWPLLQEANRIADKLHNNRLQSFAKGEIGHFFECKRNYDDYVEALDWTQKARLAASGDQVLALDTLYLWQWQTGRIYAALGDLDKAIDFYSQATANLDDVRDEILASNQSLQFDFRDAVAPVYRELAEIQLSLIPTDGAETIAYLKQQIATGKATKVSAVPSNSKDRIKSVLGNLDRLQLAELQNYFGSDCIVPVPERRIDEVLGEQSPDDARETIKSTALISTVILPSYTAVILTLPDQTFEIHPISITEKDLRTQVVAFRNSLEDASNALVGYDLQYAQKLYRELIKPLEQELKDNNIQTLVFVHDGILRNIPMAALHDGEQYLIQKYAVVISPSLQVPQTDSQAIINPKALALGLTQESTVNDKTLRSLPYVNRELDELKKQLPDSQVLLDDSLTKEQLQKTLKRNTFPVIHIATHGRFGTDPQSTFLVMGNQDQDDEDRDGNTLENRLLRLGELDTIIRANSPQAGLLELIVLSACQTASGDERATLGLAGTTIRAGAKTALASLWSVDDGATANLITYFYQAWREEGKSKAEALRSAQVKIMQNPKYLNHPAYWSAFVLAGDWQ